MLEDVICLVNEEFIFDDIGRQKAKQTKTEIFAEVKSVSQTEFFEAGRNGLKPDYKVTVWSCEYNGEMLAEYNEVLYEIYRTYLAGDKTELYFKKKEGILNG